MAAGFVEKVSEKVSFATKVPMLMKATSDNETPTAGYLYQEINTSDNQFNADILRTLDDDFSTKDECDEDTTSDGRLESQLVDKITEEGGVRTVPSRQSLEQFTQR
ncbi:hypothetical protein QZH41_013967 [Actinostola sp. cb2023]|nr:hypothetical protein QZH41_013967 [Actinostola sp. cb2023]